MNFQNNLRYLFLLGPVLGMSSAQPPKQYLDNLVISQTLDIWVCPSEVETRAGSFAFKAPGDAVNPMHLHSPIDVTISVNETRDCLEDDSSQQYAFFINFRSLQVNQDKVPVYRVQVDDPRDHGRKQKEPNMSKLNYALPEFQTHPSSELQYLSTYSHKPSITVHLKVQRRDFTDFDWDSLVIDYVLLSQSSQVNTTIYCDSLQSYVPKLVYCLPADADFMACPANCSNVSGFTSVVSEYDKQSFSYGSCGRQHSPVKCGWKEEAAHEHEEDDSVELVGRQTVNFILSWEALGGIIAGSVVLFLLFPLVIVCMSYWRHKR